MARRRQPDGRPTIYMGKDGLYHAWPTVGTKPNGTPHRKHIKRAKAEDVAEAMNELLGQVKKGHDVTSKTLTYGEWLDHWVYEILWKRHRLGDLSRNGFDDIASIVKVWLKPHAGGKRLKGRKNRLEPGDFEDIYLKQKQAGLSKSYIRRTHTHAGNSCRTAYRRGAADRVVTDLIEAKPKVPVRSPRPISLQDTQAILTEALSNNDGLAARWVLGILVGPRGGEVCGFHWSDSDLDPADPEDVPYIRPDTQIQRFTWRHGCPDPMACNRTRVKNGKPHDPCRHKPCPPRSIHGCDGTCGKQLARYCPDRKVDPERPCTYHTRLEHCQPCKPDCVGHASTCPDRVDGGVQEVDLKTEQSHGTIALTGPMADVLRRHREQQIQLFAAAGAQWTPDVHMFVDPKTLKPIDGRRDWENWQQLLERAGVKPKARRRGEEKRLPRLHDMRHSTGTYLRATGSDLKLIKEILRQAQLSVTDAYTEEALEAKREAVERMWAALVDGDLTKIVGAKKVAL